MKEDKTPDLEKLCRLCIKEENVSFHIFSTDDSQLSIPMRIMTMASLEVKATDGLPKKICSDCRYELERSFLFRKRCQQAENKLRKHIRLVASGKKSRLFRRLEDDESDEDELEFEDSVSFLKQQDELKAKNTEEEYKQEMETVFAKKLEESEVNIRKECELKLRDEVMETVRNELKNVVRDEVKRDLRSEVIAEVRAELHDEVKEESRKEQISVLMDELESFLNEKKATDVHRTNYNIIEKAARNAEILPQVMDICHEDDDDDDDAQLKIPISRTKCSAKQDGPEVDDNEFLTLSMDSMDGDIEDDTQLDKEENAEDVNSSNNNIYIISDNIEIAKSENLSQDQETPLTINDDLDADSFNIFESDDKRITSYKIKESGGIQVCKKKTRIVVEEPQQESSSSVVLLDLDDDVVEFVNMSDKSFFLKEKIDDPQTEKFVSGNRETKQFSKVNVSSSGYVTNIEENDNNSTTGPQRLTDTVKTFECKLCPIVFSTENSLKRHMRSHQRVEEKGIRYECPVCKLYLSCSSALKRHVLIHTGEKPFVCSECGKSFVQREILKRHMDTHTGIRPFKCQHCNQRFAQKINLQTHVSKMHLDGPTWHTCHLCSKKFSHASGLSRHLRTHTGIMYQCVECLRHFAERSSVKRHYTTVHGETNKTDESYVIVVPEK